jgi:hypothetical protein
MAEMALDLIVIKCSIFNLAISTLLERKTMRFNRLKFISTILVVFTIFILGCEKNDESESDNYAIATVDHSSGFDFSENKTPGTDAFILRWQPGGAKHPNYSNNGDYLWWSNNVDGTNRTKDLGTVTLSSIAEAPTNWEVSPNITPLLVGHAYVAKCVDGYVKFKVVSLSVKDYWPVEIKYYFSSTSTFDH